MCILLQKSVKLNAGAKNISKYFSKDLFYTEQKKVNFSEIITLIDEMENAANILLEKLPKNILNECQLMLEQFKRIAKADKVAVNSLMNGKLCWIKNL